jgi:hypothetical protein
MPHRSALPWVLAAFLLFAGCSTPTASEEVPVEDPSIEDPAPSNPAIFSNTIYGSGLASDGLANTRVGGPFNTALAFRVRSSYSGLLEAIRVYLVWGNGYSGGTGGTVQVSLQTASSTTPDTPSGQVLTSASIVGPDSSIKFRTIRFDRSVALSAGTVYYIVFNNSDPNPTQNFYSVNALYYQQLSSPRQPAYTDGDWDVILGVPLSSNSQAFSWRVRDVSQGLTFNPIMELQFADGYRLGSGYMEVWVGNPKPISGASRVRQQLTPKQDLRVSEASVRVRRVSGNGSLTIRLERSDGRLIEQANLPSTLIDTAAAKWVTWKFARIRSLTRDQGYNLVLSSTADTRYEAFPIRKGSDYGFSPTTYFNDGYAQFNNGTGWAGWDQWGGRDLRTGDLQFYFRRTN